MTWLAWFGLATRWSVPSLGASIKCEYSKWYLCLIFWMYACWLRNNRWESLSWIMVIPRKSVSSRKSFKSYWLVILSRILWMWSTVGVTRIRSSTHRTMNSSWAFYNRQGSEGNGKKPYFFMVDRISRYHKRAHCLRPLRTRRSNQTSSWPSSSFVSYPLGGAT